MNEQEILTQLRKAAEEIEIPETLKPEQIEKQLQEQKAKQQQENQHLEPKKSKKIIPWRRLGSMVAVLALVVCSGVYITVTRFDKNSGTGQTDSVAMTDTQQTVGEADETGYVDVAALGTMYHPASDYKEVYQTLLKGYQQNWIEDLETSAETSEAASGLFNGCAFGPPLPFTATSTWTWVDHPVSGLRVLTERPVQTRFLFGSTP